MSDTTHDIHRFAKSSEARAISELLLPAMSEVGRNDHLDSGDIWGTIINELFAVCDIVYTREGDTPWDYNPGSFGPDELIEGLDQHDTTTLTRYGHKLNVLDDAARKAGLSY